jgi:Rrf2 family protein
VIQLTKRTEYGLIALVHMAEREGQCVSSREISERYLIPRRLLAEVLKDLCRADLIDSHRGATGGYSLALSPDHLPLSAVVAALEGRPLLTSCESSAMDASGQVGHAGPSGECSLESRCPIRSPLHRLREGLWQLMQRTTLRTLLHSTASHSEHSGLDSAVEPATLTVLS